MNFRWRADLGSAMAERQADGEELHPGIRVPDLFSRARLSFFGCFHYHKQAGQNQSCEIGTFIFRGLASLAPARYLPDIVFPT